MSASLIDSNPDRDDSVKFFWGMSAAHTMLSAIHVAYKNGATSSAHRYEAEIRDMYSKETAKTQAGLLLALFSDTKPLALGYLTEWMPDCDIKASFAIIQAHMEKAKACGKPVERFAGELEGLAKLEERTLRELVEKEKRLTEDRKRREAMRHAAGQCVLCGKEMGFLGRKLGRKSHIGCKEFISGT